MAEASLDFMADVFMASSPAEARGNPPTAEELLSRGTDAVRRRLIDQPRARARLLTVLGGVYVYMSRHEEAESALDEALVLLGGLDDPATDSSAMLYSGRVHRVLGRFDDAETLLLRGVSLDAAPPKNRPRRSLAGPTVPITATSAASPSNWGSCAPANSASARRRSTTGRRWRSRRGHSDPTIPTSPS